MPRNKPARKAKKTRKAKFPTLKERQRVLAERRNLKMARSAQAYVRGNTLKFYEWLENKKGQSIPNGPPIWICGDCHMGNLGPIADAKGNIDIQIRDLDQTVIGNPAHDLIRLGLSLASAARELGLAGEVTTAKMLEHMMDGYVQALHSDKRGDIVRPAFVKSAMKKLALAPVMETSCRRAHRGLTQPSHSVWQEILASFKTGAAGSGSAFPNRGSQKTCYHVAFAR